MIALYILGCAVGVFVLYVLFLAVCCLPIDPREEYDKNSPFYRFLLESATAAAIKLCRIRIHTDGLEKIPENTKVLFVGKQHLFVMQQPAGLYTKHFAGTPE